MNFGTRNELRHYNKRIRADRMNEIAGRVLFVGIGIYLLASLIGKLA